ncbi:M28 family metallopeptidase [Maribacter sp. R77961]|uniref:M28 family metallopeptidase n=1 Tax=Maribacter sp. R77961 TaxID=3093871 RepID=UPI0037C7E95B
MKKLIVLVQVLILWGCGAQNRNVTNTITTNEGPAGLVGKISEEKMASTIEANTQKTFASAETIENLMVFLASDDLKGRDSGSDGIEKAAEFISDFFKENNVQPYFKTYRDTLGNFDKPTSNVVGYLEGTDPQLKKEFIVVGAHYDHIGIMGSENGDVIANGANDNASGTSVVLELARYFGGKKSNKRSILFALFSAEEKGLLGSKHLAEKLKGEAITLYTMLNFEMVGVPMVNKDHLLYVTGYELSNLAQVSNTYANEKLVGFLPKAKEFNLFKRSDNYPFHNVFNVPSQTYSTFDFTNFEHYHKVGDELNLMDFEHMASVVNKVIPVVEGIANASVKEVKYN